MDQYTELVQLVNEATSSYQSSKSITVKPGCAIKVCPETVRRSHSRLVQLLKSVPSLSEGTSYLLLSPIVLGEENAYKLMAVGKVAGFWDIYPESGAWGYLGDGFGLHPSITNINLDKPSTRLRTKMCSVCGRRMGDVHDPKTRFYAYDAGASICNYCYAFAPRDVFQRGVKDDWENQKPKPIKKTIEVVQFGTGETASWTHPDSGSFPGPTQEVQDAAAKAGLTPDDNSKFKAPPSEFLTLISKFDK